MLKHFEVENFRGFKDRLVFDLTARDYDFNKELVHDGVITVKEAAKRAGMTEEVFRKLSMR